MARIGPILGEPPGNVIRIFANFARVVKCQVRKGGYHNQFILFRNKYRIIWRANVTVLDLLGFGDSPVKYIIAQKMFRGEETVFLSESWRETLP